MKITELQCYKLASHFSLPGSDLCSSRNDFAVIVKTGVHILSFRPSLSTDETKLAVQRAIIKTPSELPLSDLPLDFSKLDREKFCLLYMDSKLMPNVEKSVPTVPYVKQIGWVDLRSSIRSRSVLGVLTNHGCFQLFTYYRFKWVKVADISALWKQHCMKSILADAGNDFEDFKRRYKCIRIVSFVWCPGFSLEDENEVLLACTSENGVVSLWRVRGNILDDQPILINTTELQTPVHSLCWHSVSSDSGWMVVSSTDGTVKMYSCKKNYDTGQILVTLLYSLWADADRIWSGNVKVKTHLDRSIVVLSKENYVLIFHLDSEVRVITHEFENRVAALEFMDESTVFVSLINSKTYTLVIAKNSCESVPIPFSTSTNIKNHRCAGVAFSKNKVFCLFSLNIATFHDHLTLKEPWYLLLCSAREEITLQVLQDIVIRGSVHDAFDCIENFRLHSIKNQSFIDSSMLDVMWSYLDKDAQTRRRLLQLLYILVCGCQLSRNPDDVFAIETLLNVCNFHNYEENKTSPRRQYFFYKWLRTNSTKLPEQVSGSKLMKVICSAMDAFQFDDSDVKCELCPSPISSHDSLKYVICDKGHKVLRCSYSFIPIGLQPYLECSFCHSVMIQSEDVRRCVTCDCEL